MGTVPLGFRKYELAKFLASPAAQDFEERIAAEWRWSEDFAKLHSKTPPDDRRYGEEVVSAFRDWLNRRALETRGAGAG